jgi:hypothetical protein
VPTQDDFVSATINEIDGLPRTRVMVEEGIVATTDLESGTSTDLGVGESTLIAASPPFEFNHEWTRLAPSASS